MGEFLTNSERIAREFLLRLIKEASIKPYEDSLPVSETELPPWFDEKKYKRGQKYFFDNQLGMLLAQISGLFCLLAESKGILFLNGTGRSSTPEAAGKRFISTAVNILSWYKHLLKPGSKGWTSLKKVRKMHYYASISLSKKNIGFITQLELSLATFGFMGLAVVRPKYFGIKYDNREDLEGFVHLWATISYMLGVKDKYNCCLLELDAFKVFCQMLTRYLFMPLIQVETDEYKQIVTTTLSRMNSSMKIFDYKSQLFITKSVLGVPGYQCEDNIEEILPCRDILTDDDIAEIKSIKLETYDFYHHLSKKILLYDFDGNEENFMENENLSDECITIQNFLQAKTNKQVRIKVIRNEIEFRNNLNDFNYHKLAPYQKRIIKIINYGKIIYKFKLGKFIIDMLLYVSFFLFEKTT